MSEANKRNSRQFVGTGLSRDGLMPFVSRDKPAPTPELTKVSKIIIAACCLSFSLAVCSCRQSPTTVYLKGDAMGTFYTVQYWSKKAHEPQRLDTAVKEILNEFENQLSNWRSDSWVSRFNAAPANTPIHLPEHAFEVVSLSLQLAERTNGAFDPTLSPLIQLWGFGTESKERIPEKSSIRAALQKVGYHKLVLDRDQRVLVKTDPNLQLNCSAVAKGYAVDLVAQELKERGIAGMLINIGGEVYAAGTKSDGSSWTVGIQENLPNGQTLRSNRTFPLHDQALATSGHSQRVFFRNGQRYSHILDAKTGHPVEAPFASASVVAPNCALADGLATIALIIDDDSMKQLASEYDGIEYFYTPWNASLSDTGSHSISYSNQPTS